jgi:hypothetical protein
MKFFDSGHPAGKSSSIWIRPFVARSCIQMAFLLLVLVFGAHRLHQVCDALLIRECLWILPTAFLLGHLFFARKIFWAEEPLSSKSWMSYRSFSERFWLICMVLLLVIGQLSPR